MNVDRQNFCKLLVKNGIKLIIDENASPDNPATLLGRDGKIIGYYSILLDYDIDTDSFLVGHKKYVSSTCIYNILGYDASKITDLQLRYETYRD